jgi:hypothetical protein
MRLAVFVLAFGMLGAFVSISLVEYMITVIDGWDQREM